jgi:hypothetical protein
MPCLFVIKPLDVTLLKTSLLISLKKTGLFEGKRKKGHQGGKIQRAQKEAPFLLNYQAMNSRVPSCLLFFGYVFPIFVP